MLPFAYSVPCSDLNNLFEDKPSLYNYLSRTRFLPSPNSRACTIGYLTRILQNTPGIYVQYRNIPKFNTYHFTRRGSRLHLIHEYLENLLISKNLPKLGFDSPSYRADWNWYANIIVFLEPEDKLSLLHRRENIAYEIDVNPIMVSDEDYKALLALPPLKKASNLVLHTKEDLKRNQKEKYLRQMESMERSGRIISSNIQERAAENLRKIAILHQSKAYTSTNVELLKKRFLDAAITGAGNCEEEEKMEENKELDTNEPGSEFLAKLRKGKPRPPKNYRPLRPTNVRDIKFKRIEMNERAFMGFSNELRNNNWQNDSQNQEEENGASSYSNVVFKRFHGNTNDRGYDIEGFEDQNETEVHVNSSECLCCDCLQKAMVPRVSGMIRRLESKIKQKKLGFQSEQLEEAPRRVEFKRFEEKEERDDGMSAVTREIFKKYLAAKNKDDESNNRIEIPDSENEEPESSFNEATHFDPFVNQENMGARLNNQQSNNEGEIDVVCEVVRRENRASLNNSEPQAETAKKYTMIEELDTSCKDLKGMDELEKTRELETINRSLRMESRRVGMNGEEGVGLNDKDLKVNENYDVRDNRSFQSPNEECFWLDSKENEAGLSKQIQSEKKSQEYKENSILIVFEDENQQNPFSSSIEPRPFNILTVLLDDEEDEDSIFCLATSEKNTENKGCKEEKGEGVEKKEEISQEKRKNQIPSSGSQVHRAQELNEKGLLSLFEIYQQVESTKTTLGSSQQTPGLGSNRETDLKKSWQVQAPMVLDD